MDIEKIQKEIKMVLSEKRYYHSVCVMERCEIIIYGRTKFSHIFS